MRYSTNPERLEIGGFTYRPTSGNATTFFVLDGVVAHSHDPHMTIINGIRKMQDVNDSKATREYGITLSFPLAQTTLDRFKKCRVILGEIRAANKAGRLWRNVKTDVGETVSFISFWARAESIMPPDLELLRRTFKLKGRVLIECIDSKDTIILPAQEAGS
jgi:hypothetical protein